MTDLIYELKLNNNKIQNVIASDYLRSTNSTTYPINGDVKYSISIRCRVNGSHNTDLWSEAISKEFVTPPRKPDNPPNVIGFSTRETKQILIYWQELEAIQHNGPDLCYNVTAKNVGSVESCGSFAVLNV